MRDLVLMEEPICRRASWPIDQVMLASHAILEHGTKPQRRAARRTIRA
jgi:hypothetical protein